MAEKYPDSKDIKVQWTKLNTILVLVVTFILIFFLIFQPNLKPLTLGQIVNIISLYINFLGIIVISLKTPYYGTFFDGGKIEEKRQKVEKKYFDLGMILIVIGMFFQGLSALI